MVSPEFIPVGMQIVSLKSDLNGIYFLHDTPQCQSSFLVLLKYLEPYLSEPVLLKNSRPPTACDSRCQNIYNMEPCSLPCYLAPFYRLFLHMVKYREDVMSSRNLLSQSLTKAAGY